ncbi:MAG TPA: TlpA disulfide reductase family protein [Terriglobales bacterium]|jgi:peroxiredoxin|nr:TlpA disulfide reductase family protein [Terriglobales bacterium]
MTALTSGTKAPDFTLPTIDGGKFSLSEELKHGPVVLAFFKVSCPTCQYAFPFLQRIFKAYAGRNVTIVGISQNPSQDTAAFLERFGVTFPVLLDDPNNYLVSNAYGLTNVPTTFWVGQDGEIEISSVGWVKKEMEEINRKAAGSSDEIVAPLFQAAESVVEFRAG